ncbi:SRPBCC domain-containing protein [Salinibacterium sp. G-O1]|uniref:SRPBCC domain-containing protein n=1 Tax=Salinibacterium sp. G-O1 TaxID=3046208 RepID=UPI0024BA59A5|nr:SRPBCC domain-containing protein [Salinibacterium sp. G-O1]MDJ0334046.1 SRPBCC domain-containing protein [Salinibacterium sp. G-O1]
MRTTNNEASVIDTTALTVRRTITIAAPIDSVWSAVTVPEHISQWFGRVELSPVSICATGTITWPERAPLALRIEALDAPRMIAYRWCGDGQREVTPQQMDEEHSTVFTFTLEEYEGGTRLTVVETGFDTASDPIADMEDHRGGWDAELDKLVALLERTS